MKRDTIINLSITLLIGLLFASLLFLFTSCARKEKHEPRFELPDEERCEGITENGQRCFEKKYRELKFCVVHKD